MPRIGAADGMAASWQAGREGGAAPWPSPAAGGAAGARRLRDAAERAARHPRGRAALVLHLSRLRPPAPRPHHERVARAILGDVAGRREGDVFALRNRDLVLLCREGPEIAAMPAMLARLLRLDAPDPASLVSFWPLDQDGGALLDYAAARLAEGGTVDVPREPAEPVSPVALDAVAAALGALRWDDLAERQTVVRLEPRPGRPAALRALFRAVGVPLSALAASVAEAGPLAADPALAPLLATQVDAALLRLLADRLGHGGPLDGALPGAPPLLLTLTLPAMLSPGFAAFARTCHSAGAAPGIALAPTEAAADPAGFRTAREVATEHGLTLALVGVTPLALTLARPWALGADLLLLAWAAHLPQAPEEDRTMLADALREADPARVVLTGATDEAALRWGGAHGIRRFQGRHVEAMLAAARLVACPASDGCTLAQCGARAAATGAAGRMFCRRPDLLDAGVPAHAT